MSSVGMSVTCTLCSVTSSQLQAGLEPRATRHLYGGHVGTLPVHVHFGWRQLPWRWTSGEPFTFD